MNLNFINEILFSKYAQPNDEKPNIARGEKAREALKSISRDCSNLEGSQQKNCVRKKIESAVRKGLVQEAPIGNISEAIKKIANSAIEAFIQGNSSLANRIMDEFNRSSSYSVGEKQYFNEYVASGIFLSLIHI